MKYSYHYCVIHQNMDRSITYFDGITHVSSKIDNYNEYSKMKELIAKEESLDRKSLTITNLSFMGEVK